MGATIQALLEDYAEMAGSLGTDDRRSFEEEEEEEEEEEGKAEYPDDGCERYHATMEYSMSPGCITSTTPPRGCHGTVSTSGAPCTYAERRRSSRP
jgi:hypothetical protein